MTFMSPVKIKNMSHHIGRYSALKLLQALVLLPKRGPLTNCLKMLSVFL